ncbi:MAG: fibronectin type III domain-containing protein [bacterium JZ-2024 1]
MKKSFRQAIFFFSVGILLARCGGGGAAPPVPAPGGIPAPPTNVSASQGEFEDFIRITWNPVPGATGYFVYRAEEGSTVFTEISGFFTTTLYDDASAKVGKRYQYRVKAGNARGLSDFSEIALGFRRGTPPPAPQNVSASEGAFTHKIVVTWDTVASASLYRIYRSENPEVSPTTPYAESVQNRFEDTNVQPATPYWYRISAVNNLYGEGPKSEPPKRGFVDVSPPLPPATVSASQGTRTDGIELNWTPSARALSYEILRSPQPDAGYALIASVSTNQYLDSSPDLEPGRDYYYRIRSRNENGSGSPSSPPAVGWKKPTPPSGLTATTNLPDRIRLSWQGIPGAEYLVEKTTITSDEFVLLVETTAVIYEDFVAPGSVFRYRVRSRFNQRVSEPSADVTGRTLPPPGLPPAPTGVIASDGSFLDKINITWTPVTGVLGYRIFRAEETTAPFVFLADVTDASYDDFSIVPGKRYFYIVRSRNEAGFSPDSLRDSGWAKPPAPAWITASQGQTPAGQTDRIRIEWAPVTGFNRFALYRSESPTGPFTFLLQSDIRATFTEDSFNLVPGVKYYYVVRTQGEDELSDMSPVAEGFIGEPVPVPPAPTGVQATDGTYEPGKVRITWNPTPNATRYQVYRSEFRIICQPDLHPISPDTVTDVSWVDDLTNQPEKIEQRFCYYVRAFNVFGGSPYSAFDIGWASGLAPPPPSGVVASDPVEHTPSYPDRVEISWNASPGASRYIVLRSDNPVGPYQDISGILLNVLRYSDRTAVPGQQYYYKVSAGNAFGFSEPAPFGVGDIGAPTPPTVSAPTEISATKGDFSNFIAIYWPRVPGATFYRLYRSDQPDGQYFQVGRDLYPVNREADFCPEDTRPSPVPKPPFHTHMCYIDKVPPDGDVVVGKQYWYRVEALNLYNRSGLSSVRDMGYAFVAPTRPNPPVDFTATPQPGAIRLTWKKNLERNISHYRIYKNISPNVIPVPDTTDPNHPENAPYLLAQLNVDITSFTDNPGCRDNIQPGQTEALRQSVCYGTQYYYVITAVSEEGLQSVVSPVASAYPNPPYKPSFWPRQAGRFFKSSVVIAELDDPDARATNNRQFEICAFAMDGVPRCFSPNGAYYNGSYLRLGGPSWPLPSFGDEFRSSPAIGRVVDIYCPVPGVVDPYVYGPTCSEDRGSLLEGTVERQIVIGGNNVVYVFRHEGCRWCLNVTMDEILASHITLHTTPPLGFVSATPVLYDVVAWNPNFRDWLPGQDGAAEVFFASENAWVVALHFLDTSNDGIPDSSVQPYNSGCFSPHPPFPYPNCVYDPDASSTNFIRGFPKRLPTGKAVRASPAVTDLDLDGRPDLIVAGTDGCIYAWTADSSYEKSGQNLFGFPACIADAFRSSPTIADINRDGKPEIVLGADNGNIYAIDNQGRILWIKQTGSPVESSAAIVDVDEDATLEVIIGADNGKIYLLNGEDGSDYIPCDPANPDKPCWPFSTNDVVRASPVVASVDWDPEMEIIAASFDGSVWALNLDGTVVPGWPIRLTAPVFSSPAVAHLDADPLIAYNIGDTVQTDRFLELVFGADDFLIHVFEMRGATLSTGTFETRRAPLWSMFRGNPCRNGTQMFDNSIPDNEPWCNIW